MGVYHQMGHDSKNLLCVPELDQFIGAILSPVNYCEADIISQIALVREKPGFEMIFDPQLYYPKSESGQLRGWEYFPDDVDTSDMQSEQWWCEIIDKIVSTCSRVQPTAVCSPAFAHRAYPNEYYRTITQMGNYLVKSFLNTGIQTIQTVICNLNDLSVSTRALEIASIISQSKAQSVYLVFVNNVIPRRELSNTEELKGAMRLITSIEKSGMPVLVGFTSSDLVLWKAAGATACATGKFFNLRRFTSTRFEEPSERGGGQLPYWFEESILAFLRESDIIRIRKAKMLSKASLANPFGCKILEQMDNSPEKAWLAISWRQYLYAFADLERRIENGQANIQQLLINAEQNWAKMDEDVILLEEIKNNGEWVRSWRRAILEFGVY